MPIAGYSEPVPGHLGRHLGRSATAGTRRDNECDGTRRRFHRDASARRSGRQCWLAAKGPTPAPLSLQAWSSSADWLPRREAMRLQCPALCGRRALRARPAEPCFARDPDSCLGLGAAAGGASRDVCEFRTGGGRWSSRRRCGSWQMRDIPFLVSVLRADCVSSAGRTFRSAACPARGGLTR